MTPAKNTMIAGIEIIAIIDADAVTKIVNSKNISDKKIGMPMEQFICVDLSSPAPTVSEQTAVVVTIRLTRLLSFCVVPRTTSSLSLAERTKPSVGASPP